MPVEVRIPGPLRRVTAGQGSVKLEVASVTQCVESLEAQFPGMRERLLDESGELRRFVNIYVNGEDVRFLQGLGTALKAGDVVTIVPAVAGGAGPSNTGGNTGHR